MNEKKGCVLCGNFISISKINKLGNILYFPISHTPHCLNTTPKLRSFHNGVLSNEVMIGIFEINFLTKLVKSKMAANGSSNSAKNSRSKIPTCAKEKLN